MRHRKGFNHLGRTSSHRKAMLANMATSLILHKRITTTSAKAKALRSYVEPLITKSKDDSTHSRRVVFSYLKNKYAVSELFREISPKIVDRPGGYTRILKLGNRLGDNADMCIIELVDYNENMLEDTAKKAKSTRRRRGGSAKKTETTGESVDTMVAEETVSEATPVEDVTEAPDTENIVETAEEDVVVEDKTEEVVDTVEAVEEEIITEEAPAKDESEEPKKDA
jgi:large subunit ribosomal protein L17